ncbi:hypothetical protein N7509_013001 [Penicillium cosmopolitanum]|uniref:Glucose-methanol-choline oxidoreductase N-terminal domain-containing protein n=1 Tax=Penicillium cosmopolitanum TaxID=1131564 RepID=A0A9W9SD01_9EURO|nr:uncharacterized protein N7509_013001 [Penicillium cosmopolitanum]KAJ5376115.1 hypothetical protein N7509_013001 [Penicillium cosmopolitanum]
MPRGRVLGGTSALNFMAWNRAHRHDYDAWADLGNAGWGWEDLLPYFLRSETFHPPSAAHQKDYKSSYQAEFNGTKGAIQTTHSKEYGPTHQYWHDTMNALNIPSSEDSLAGANYGAWNMVCSIDPRQQTRSYAASAYYAPIASRKNLHVFTNTTVLKVLLEKDDSGLRATGASVCHDQHIGELKARREVILSAGTIQSPQLLEISGIGARGVLEAAGIEVKFENKNVGENLQDHMMFASIYEVLPTLSSRDNIIGNPILRAAADHAYQTSQTGPWTVLPCSVAYCSVSDITSEKERCALISFSKGLEHQLGDDSINAKLRQHVKQTLIPTSHGRIEYIFDLGNWCPFFKSDPDKKYATMLQILQYPLSQGSVHIRARLDEADSVSAEEMPILDPKYYLGMGQFDKKIMALARKFADKICQTEPLAGIIKGRVFPPLPDDSNIGDRASDLGTMKNDETEKNEQLDDGLMERYTITDWHPIGTCAMGGSGGARDGVVDEHLRVYGVHGLRVIDASIMPLQIGAHPQATVYAIAEKGAAMIIEDWKRT